MHLYDNPLFESLPSSSKIQIVLFSILTWTIMVFDFLLSENNIRDICIIIYNYLWDGFIHLFMIHKNASLADMKSKRVFEYHKYHCNCYKVS